MQEVQLFTADVDNRVMTMGLRTSYFDMEPSKADSSSPVQQPKPQQPSTGKAKSSSQSPVQHHTQLGSQTHFSANNLQSQGFAQGTSSRTNSAAPTSGSRGSKMHEVTADSEEVKGESGSGSGRDVEQDSPHSSLLKDALGLGQGRHSSSVRASVRSPQFNATTAAEGKQPGSSLPAVVHSPQFNAANAAEGNQQSSSQQSAELQERGSGGSHGSAEMPASTAVPSQLMTSGNRLQLQTFITIQNPVQLLSPANSVR